MLLPPAGEGWGGGLKVKIMTVDSISLYFFFTYSYSNYKGTNQWAEIITTVIFYPPLSPTDNTL